MVCSAHLVAAANRELMLVNVDYGDYRLMKQYFSSQKYRKLLVITLVVVVHLLAETSILLVL